MAYVDIISDIPKVPSRLNRHPRSPLIDSTYRVEIAHKANPVVARSRSKTVEEVQTINTTMKKSTSFPTERRKSIDKPMIEEEYLEYARNPTILALFKSFKT
jgi:hypothetical protein